MRLDLYQRETARIAAENQALLRQATKIMHSRALSALEEGGVLHALQVLIENAIGKAKQLLKLKKQVVPVSAYDVFRALAVLGVIAMEDLPAWNAIVGLRNRIVHDYMNIEMTQVLLLISEQRSDFVVRFLLQEFSVETGN